MMRALRCLVTMLFVLMVGIGSSNAQFSISKVAPADIKKQPVRDTLIIVDPPDNVYTSLAKKEAERRALRKKRNTFEFTSTLQASQTQFENWASGGDNTFSARATVFMKYRHDREKRFMEARVEGRYGMNYIESKRHKNEDEFKIHGSTGWRLHKNWYYSGSVNLRSQFMSGYKSRDDRTKTSSIMAPGFLEVAIGIKYDKKPFMLELSPIGGSAVFVLDKDLRDRGMHGVEKGEASKWEVGPSIRAEVDMEFWREVFRLRSYFNIFTNMKKAPVMRWETTLDIRATSFLTTTLYGLLYFDKKAITPDRGYMQLKYSISIGLSYRFSNK